jgi:hypothetical protein
MQFATGDGRAAGHIGAVLVLGAAPGFSVPEARRVLGERIRAVPRLRQRLYRAPPGCGRPYWADDPAFDIIPIPSTTGNVTVTFAAASYAGTLYITILSDPSRMPDAPALAAAALRHELSAEAPWPRSFA